MTPTPPPASAWAAWTRFWFAPADPTVLGFIRVVTGLLVLYDAVAYSFDLANFFGPTAYVDLASVDRERKEMPTFVGPRPASLLELIARHVGPQGAANVLRVDDDVGHPEVVAGFLGEILRIGVTEVRDEGVRPRAQNGPL